MLKVAAGSRLPLAEASSKAKQVRARAHMNGKHPLSHPYYWAAFAAYGVFL